MDIVNLIKHHLVIIAELKPLIEKIDGFLKNPEKLSTTKVSEHIPPGFQCLQYYHLNI